MRTYGIVFAFLSLLPVVVSAQGAGDSITAGLVAGARYHYGFLVVHSRKMSHLVEKHSPGFEVTLSRHTTGKRPWERVYGYPETGIVLLRMDLGNPGRLGMGYAVMPYLDVPLRRRARSAGRFRVCSGIGYVEKVFDRLGNYKNNAISSHFNAALQLLYETRYVITGRLNLHAGIGFTHFSNGAVSTPNLGLNIPTLNLGLSFHTELAAALRLEPEILPVNRRMGIALMAAGGIKETDPPGGPKYATYTFQASAAREVGPKGRLGGNLDVFYDNAVYSMALDDAGHTASGSDGLRLGLGATYELVLGRFSLLIGKGVYLYQAYNARHTFYHRIGHRYFISERLFANLSLKTHYGNADHLEVGLGCRLGR